MYQLKLFFTAVALFPVFYGEYSLKKQQNMVLKRNKLKNNEYNNNDSDKQNFLTHEYPTQTIVTEIHPNKSKSEHSTPE